MFKSISNLWKRFTTAVDKMISGRNTLNNVIDDGDETDRKEIEQANAVIVNHQYLKHMAEARIAGRKSWRELQAQANTSTNVTPLLIAEHARARKT